MTASEDKKSKAKNSMRISQSHYYSWGRRRRNRKYKCEIVVSIFVKGQVKSSPINAVVVPLVHAYTPNEKGHAVDPSLPKNPQEAGKAKTEIMMIKNQEKERKTTLE